MAWFCPTFQRPERLAELALSWEKNAKGKELHVRVWDKDPRKEDYFKYEWPEGWKLYESDKEWAGDALNEHFDWNSNDRFYGFIGDDIVLRTKGGLDVLEAVAGRMFLSYPNDTRWRHQLATHFCLGGDTARVMGFVVPRQFYHYNMDYGLFNIAINCGLQRYCPQVIFHHKHFMLDERVERDETYRKVWGDGPVPTLSADLLPGQKELEDWKRHDFPDTVQALRIKLVTQYERREEWDAEDYQMLLEGDSGDLFCAQEK